jgi:transposase
MQHQLQMLLRRQFGRKSEKLDPNQMLLFGEVAEETPTVGDPIPPAPSDAKPARSGGRQKLPADLPRQQVVHALTEETLACPECGEQRREIGRETREQLEYIPASLRVIEHVRLKYACKGCEGHVAIAPIWPEPIERGLPGTGLLAHIAVSKYVDHLPLHRQERIFARQGVTLARSTTCDWMAVIAELLEPIWKAMKARVLLSDVIRTDDTPVGVQDPAVPGKNRTGRIWVYLGDRRHRFTVFDYTPDWSGIGPARFLAEYKDRFLQSDGYAGYNALHERGLIEVGCWAHARRKFYDARSSDPNRSHAALAWIGRLYEVEREANVAIAERLSREGGLGEEERWAIEDEIRSRLRHEQSRPIIESFANWLETTSQQVLPRSPLGEAAAYARSHWAALCRYLDAPILAPDNNASENALRSIAVGRKNWLHLGSDAGGRTAAVLMTVLQSCSAFDVEPWAYLKDVLDRISTHPASRITELLPDAWKPCTADAPA